MSPKKNKTTKPSLKKAGTMTATAAVRSNFYASIFIHSYDYLGWQRLFKTFMGHSEIKSNQSLYC